MEVDCVKTIEAIRGLSDKDLKQLERFAAGIDTVNDMQERLAVIATSIVRQKMKMCMGIFRFIPELIDERKT